MRKQNQHKQGITEVPETAKVEVGTERKQGKY
jgi:hypothetical protein